MSAFERPPGAGGEVELAVNVGSKVEVSAVDEVMAADAQADEVVEVGTATFGPPGDVVDLQMGIAAAGCGALAALSGDDGVALFHGGEA